MDHRFFLEDPKNAPGVAWEWERTLKSAGVPYGLILHPYKF
jgi:hypothetical protein